MQVSREELNPCTIKLTIHCDPEEVEAGFDRAFRRLTKKIKLPGFRPGHAPRSMLEGLIDGDDLGEAAADEVVRSTLPRAIEQEKIEPDQGTQQSVELVRIERTPGACEFSAKIPLPPKVKLGDYKGLPIQRPSVDVSDEEVDRQIDEFRQRGSVRQAVTDRGVEDGDAVVLNVRLDGEAPEGRNFMTMAGQTFPQLDEAVRGMRVEEMKHLELSFPQNFQEKDWAGKTLAAQITVNSIASTRLPELDEAFARKYSTENVEELREKVRAALRGAKENMANTVIHDQLLDALRERSTVEVSDNMWEALAQRRLRETAEAKAKEGKSLEAYAQENGMGLDELIQAWRERAKTEVQRALLLQRVFTAEKMQLTNGDLNRELIVMAAEYQVEADEMVNLLRKNDALDELQFRAMTRKVSQFLLANAADKQPEPVGAP